MMRPLYAMLGALALLLLWLGLVAYQTNGDVAASLAAVGDGAQRARLPGVAAKCYLLASQQERQRLQGMDRETPQAQALVERIIARRMAAARVLLHSGYVEAAERIALEGARANYDDLQARALLLEIRLQGQDSDAAKRELMLLVLKDEHPQLLYLLGKAFADTRQDADAESFYRRALALDAGHVPSLLGMARLAARRYDGRAVNGWLDKAEQAAEQPDEKRIVAQLRPAAPEPWQRARDAVAWFGREHVGSFLFLAAYVVFLISPAIYARLRKSPVASILVKPTVDQVVA